MSPKKRVLIVDDAKFTRVRLRRILNDTGFLEVCGEASNGNEAITQFKKLKPDIITMDLMMPEKNGIEAIEAIRKLSNDVIIIVVSTMGQETIILEATMKGAKDFLTKPFRLNEVLNAMRRIVKVSS